MSDVGYAASADRSSQLNDRLEPESTRPVTENGERAVSPGNRLSRHRTAFSHAPSEQAASHPRPGDTGPPSCSSHSVHAVELLSAMSHSRDHRQSAR